jgi:hypothetical protein
MNTVILLSRMLTISSKRFRPFMLASYLSIFPTIFMISPSLAGTASLTSPKPSQDLPTCFIQSKSGELIDLTSKCGFVKPLACSSSLGSASRDAVLMEFCRRNERCLLNNTCNTMPRGIQAPPPGTPMGRNSSRQLIA